MYFYKRGRKESTMNRFNTNVRAVVVTVKTLSCVRLYRLVKCSTPGFSVLHRLPEFVHIHVH